MKEEVLFCSSTCSGSLVTLKFISSLLPAMGMVSEILTVNSRKPIFGYMAMVGSLFAIAILAFLVWAHHMFVTGLNPFLGSILCVANIVDRRAISY